MRFPNTHPLTSLLPLLPLTSIVLNIIVNNDNGLGSANIRELYRLLNAAGHNAWVVAPVSNHSRMGSTGVFTTEVNLTAPSELALVPKGAPSFGTDPNDSHIWYYNNINGETTVVRSGCFSSVSVFTVDYDAPSSGSKKVRKLLELLVKHQNATTASRNREGRSNRSARLVGDPA